MSVGSFGPSLSSRSQRAFRQGVGFADRGGLIRLDRNEDPEGWSSKLFREFIADLEPTDIAAYPDPTRLIESLSNALQVPKECLLISSGSTEGLRLIFETYGHSGVPVIHTSPSYSLFGLYERVEGCDFRPILLEQECSEDTPWRRLVEAAESTPGSLVVLINPDQPSGEVRSLEEVRALADACQSSGSLLVVDEAYYLFGAPSAQPLLKTHQNLIIVRTFSKVFGMAGARIGFVAADGAVIDDLRRLELAVPPSMISIKMASFAIDHLDLFEEHARDVIAGREFLLRELLHAGVKSRPSGGNFLLISGLKRPLAERIAESVRQRGYAIKGPLDLPVFGFSLRVTTGGLQLMKRFWSDTGEVFLNHLAP